MLQGSGLSTGCNTSRDMRRGRRGLRRIKLGGIGSVRAAKLTV